MYWYLHMVTIIMSLSGIPTALASTHHSHIWVALFLMGKNDHFEYFKPYLDGYALRNDMQLHKILAKALYVPIKLQNADYV